MCFPFIEVYWLSNTSSDKDLDRPIDITMSLDQSNVSLAPPLEIRSTFHHGHINLHNQHSDRNEQPIDIPYSKSTPPSSFDDGSRSTNVFRSVVDQFKIRCR